MFHEIERIRLAAFYFVCLSSVRKIFETVEFFAAIFFKKTLHGNSMALQPFIGPQIEFTLCLYQSLLQSVLYFLTAVPFTKGLSETGAICLLFSSHLHNGHATTCVEGIVFRCLQHYVI